MGMEAETQRGDDVTAPELPNGWQWAGGERGENDYTVWFETKYRMGGPLAGVHGFGGYNGVVYWDAPELSGRDDHTVQIRPITHPGPKDGDSTYGYPVVSRRYDSEQEALDAVPELIAALGE